jgi:uncharacterized protein (TIGR01777 family)
MQIAITGISGFIGGNLKTFFEENCDFEVLPVPRMLLYGSAELLADYLEGSDVVINLAGASILSRWTRKRKQKLWDSRVIPTRNIVTAFALMIKVPSVFISTSATGILDGIEEHDEYSQNYASDFLGELAQKWELEAINAHKLGIRTLIFRLGVVLDSKGGALAKMLPAFRLGFGGPVGNGNQPFPFIHIQDLMHAYLFAINREEHEGIYHLVAPELITNREFSLVLADTLHRPAWFPVPVVLLKLLFGEGASVLVGGQIVLCTRLLKSNFQFQFPTINLLLKNLVG